MSSRPLSYCGIPTAYLFIKYCRKITLVETEKQVYCSIITIYRLHIYNDKARIIPKHIKKKKVFTTVTHPVLQYHITAQNLNIQTDLNDLEKGRTEYVRKK